jgi:hypothetical protein
MQSIKAVVAAGAITVSTIGGAFAAGVVNKNGHEVNDHAAHGQAVAAAARAKHAAPSETASVEPTETATSEATETATTEDTDTATAEPTEATTTEATEAATPEASPTPHRGWTQGKHVGWSKKGKHYGVGHGKGKPALPEHTKPAHPTRPDAGN